MRTARGICGEWHLCLLPKMVKPVSGDPIRLDGHKAAEGKVLHVQPTPQIIINRSKGMIRNMVAMVGCIVGSAAQAVCPEYLDHSMRKLHSDEQVNLCETQAGKPMLVINTASHCGYPPQFKGAARANWLNL